MTSKCSYSPSCSDATIPSSNLLDVVRFSSFWKFKPCWVRCCINKLKNEGQALIFLQASNPDFGQYEANILGTQQFSVKKTRWTRKRRPWRPPRPLESMLFVHFSLPRYRSHPVHVTRARNHSQQHWFRGLHVNVSIFGRQIFEFPMFFASYCPQLGLTFPTQESTNDEKARSILLFLAIYIPQDEFRAISIVSNRIGTSVFDTWDLTRFCQNLRNCAEKVWQNWNTPKR